MATTKTIIPAGTTVRFIQIGSKQHVLWPLGSTVFLNPTSPTNSGNWLTIYANEMEIETENSNYAKDSSNPAKSFMEYVGGRPTGR